MQLLESSTKFEAFFGFHSSTFEGISVPTQQNLTEFSWTFEVRYGLFHHHSWDSRKEPVLLGKIQGKQIDASVTTAATAPTQVPIDPPSILLKPDSAPLLESY